MSDTTSADGTTISFDRSGNGPPVILVLGAFNDRAAGGAVLALRAAARGLPITKLALYDPPFQITGTSPDYWTDMAGQIVDLVSAGRRGDAVELYQTKGVGIPPEVVAQLRLAPFWPALEAIAHTLAYDSLVLACPPELLGSISTPTLVLDGEAGPDPLRAAARTVADGLPEGQLRTLPGQTHDLVPEVLGPVLEQFYTD
jgi:hypothetical protein